MAQQASSEATPAQQSLYDRLGGVYETLSEDVAMDIVVRVGTAYA